QTPAGPTHDQRESHEKFRAALQTVVSPGDPRNNLENFVKIGEGQRESSASPLRGARAGRWR
ncbi:Serine/threonine-protein kinase PAK 5, partial [Branchiostoma belcheri]